MANAARATIKKRADRGRQKWRLCPLCAEVLGGVEGGAEMEGWESGGEYSIVEAVQAVSLAGRQCSNPPGLLTPPH